MNTAVALHKKALKSGQLRDYTDSIAKFDTAAKLESSNASQFLITRTGRAETFRNMFEKFGDIQYGRKALQEFSELAVTPNGRTDVIFRAAEIASVLEVSVNSDYHAAYKQVKRAMDLFPQAVLLYSSRIEQLRLVRKYHFLPSSATALAVGAGMPASHILSGLEQTRAFIWDRFLLSDTPLDMLREKRPDLANRFEVLRSTLISQTDSNSSSIIAGILPAKDQLRLERHEKTDTFANLLRQIRQEEGFEDFLLPSFGHKENVAKSHTTPIVYLNISSYRCDAICSTPRGVHTIALDRLKMEDVIQQAIRLYEAQLQLLVEGEFENACAKFENVMLWLWETAVKPILEALEQEVSTEKGLGKQRIYWVSSGWLTIFPIHAAGDWASSRRIDTRPSVHEKVISSYVPSFRVLDFMRRRADHLSTNATQSKALLVGMPHTPDMPEGSDLDADVEVALIKSIIENDLPTQALISPSLSDVTSALCTCQLAHFACHGRADTKDPSKSALRFEDWVENPLNVRTLLNMKLANCQLAFLSACETAANKDLLLRDEGLHVAGAFNMAGVPHTVAGMWKIEDRASRELVRAFYGKLFATEKRVRYQGTAMALHAAVGHLRSEGFHPILWGAFIHIGP